jgi:hypothetical protein
LFNSEQFVVAPSGKVPVGTVLAAPQNFSQRLVYFQSPIVVYESLLPESIHEQIDARARRPDHFRQNLVTYNGDLNSWWTSPVQVG